jgi:hypothetical protein
MKAWSKVSIVLALFGAIIYPASAGANDLYQNASTRLVQVLSDHPGPATALTSKQKSEIKAILAKGKGNQKFTCTGLSLAGQSESMYRVVRLRAQLVCEFAKTVDSSVKITVRERVIKAEKLNGRVEVVSK